MNGRRLLTLEQVAAFLDTSVPHVRSLIRAGRLEAMMFSPRVWRVAPRSLARFLDATSTVSRPCATGRQVVEHRLRGDDGAPPTPQPASSPGDRRA